MKILGSKIIFGDISLRASNNLVIKLEVVK